MSTEGYVSYIVHVSFELVYRCACVWMCMCGDVHVWGCVCVYVYVCVCVCVEMCMCADVYVCGCACVWMCMCGDVYVCGLCVHASLTILATALCTYNSRSIADMLSNA